MFEIVFPKEKSDVPRDDLYLIFQTMRMTNLVKMLFYAALDIQQYAPKSMITARKTEELFLAHGANLYEVLHRMQDAEYGKSLHDRYKDKLRDRQTLSVLDGLMDLVKSDDRSIRVLEAIRNKHSAHIATDNFYIWNNISEKPNDRDIPVGVGESNKHGDWFFTLDSGLLFAHIGTTILRDSKNVRHDVITIIKEYSVRLIDLFVRIGKELLIPLFEALEIDEAQE